MSNEVPQLDLFTSIANRDIGMAAAEENANDKSPSWSEKAYNFLLKFCKSNKQFLTEELREASKDDVPEPPSTRAWGGVVVRAANNKIIKRNGFKKTTNPKAHRTPATLWKVIR